MIDKRLRQLDQIPELDYWRVGLAKNEKQQRRGKAKAAGSESKRLDNGIVEAGRSENSTPVKAGTKAQHTPIRIEPADDVVTPAAMAQGRNLVTRNFLTGFRSQFVR